MLADCVILWDNVDATTMVKSEVIHEVWKIWVPRENWIQVVSLHIGFRHCRFPQLELVDVTLEMPTVILFCFASKGTGKIPPAEAVPEM